MLLDLIQYVANVLPFLQATRDAGLQYADPQAIADYMTARLIVQEIEGR